MHGLTESDHTPAEISGIDQHKSTGRYQDEQDQCDMDQADPVHIRIGVIIQRSDIKNIF